MWGNPAITSPSLELLFLSHWKFWLAESWGCASAVEDSGTRSVHTFPVCLRSHFQIRVTQHDFLFRSFLKTTLRHSLRKLTSFAAPYYAINSSLYLLSFQHWQPFIKPSIFQSVKRKCFCREIWCVSNRRLK